MKSAYYARANSYSKSYNAIMAERDGRYSRTVSAKKLGLSLKAFDAGCAAVNYTSTEWHHVGKYANAVDYYDTAELADNPLFWKGATTRANAAYCKGIISQILRNRIAERTTLPVFKQVRILNSVLDHNEYKIDAVNEHAFRKGITEIVRKRVKLLPYKQAIETRCTKQYRRIWLNVDGTILNKSGKQILPGIINLDEYTPMGVSANGVQFWHDSTL